LEAIVTKLPLEGQSSSEPLRGYVLMSPELYEQIRGKWSKPVEVFISEQADDGRIEMQFRTVSLSRESESRS
jgi:hypothetical protein